MHAVRNQYSHWIELGHSVQMSDAKADQIVLAVDALALKLSGRLSNYLVDAKTTRLTPVRAPLNHTGY
jgi:hypothetical protein